MELVSTADAARLGQGEWDSFRRQRDARLVSGSPGLPDQAEEYGVPDDPGEFLLPTVKV